MPASHHAPRSHHNTAHTCSPRRHAASPVPFVMSPTVAHHPQNRRERDEKAGLIHIQRAKDMQLKMLETDLLKEDKQQNVQRCVTHLVLLLILLEMAWGVA